VAKPRKKADPRLAPLLAAIDQGLCPAAAAASCGIAQQELELMAASEEVARAIAQVEARSELSIIGDIRLAAKKDWKAAQWLAEHRWPDRWGKLRPGERHGDKPDDGAGDDGAAGDAGTAGERDEDPLTGVRLRLERSAG